MVLSTRYYYAVPVKPNFAVYLTDDHIKSTEDISSGYSSADNSASLTRTSSMGAARRSARTSRTTVTTIKRPQAAEAMLSASATIPRAKKSNKRKTQ